MRLRSGSLRGHADGLGGSEVGSATGPQPQLSRVQLPFPKVPLPPSPSAGPVLGHPLHHLDRPGTGLGEESDGATLRPTNRTPRILTFFACAPEGEMSHASLPVAPLPGDRSPLLSRSDPALTAQAGTPLSPPGEGHRPGAGPSRPPSAPARRPVTRRCDRRPVTRRRSRGRRRRRRGGGGLLLE